MPVIMFIVGGSPVKDKMLSTLAVRSGAFGLLKCQPQVLGASSRGLKEAVRRVNDWDEANKIFYGPERDTRNFPHPTMPEASAKVRLGFVPEEWFKFFYPKTGVTGPYLFGIGLVTTLLSKEIWVVDHGFAEVIGFYGAIWLLTNKVGKKFAAWMDTRNDQTYQERFVKPLEDTKDTAEKIIEKNEEAIWREEAQRHIWEAKRENVNLQLEAAYRKRLHDVHKEVKHRLDYMVEMDLVQRRFEQDHMVAWVVHQVKKGITPAQEQASIKECIQTLKRLAAASNAEPATA